VARIVQVKDEADIQAQRSTIMADMKDKFEKGVNKGASAAKDVGDKAIDKTKEAARAAGDKMKEAGQKVKDAGK
jgi:hypothetical protein